MPAVFSPANGFVRLTFDEATNVLTYDVTVSGVSPGLVTAAHIHCGAAGVNGPAIHTIASSGFTQVSGQAELSDADAADLKAGNLYINVHTTANPGGAARGQLLMNAADSIELSIETAFAAWNSRDLDGFLALFTDSGFMDIFDAPLAAVPEFLPEFIGDPPLAFRSLSDVTLSGRTAAAELEIAFGAVIESSRSTFALDGNCKIASLEPFPKAIPANVAAVDLELQDFAFNYDKAAASQGNIAFKISNVSAEQQHESVVVKIAGDAPLQALLASEEALFGGIELLAVAGPYDPGTETNAVFHGTARPQTLCLTLLRHGPGERPAPRGAGHVLGVRGRRHRTAGYRRRGPRGRQVVESPAASQRCCDATVRPRPRRSPGHAKTRLNDRWRPSESWMPDLCARRSNGWMRCQPSLFELSLS